MALFSSDEAFVKQVKADRQAKDLLRLICQEMIKNQGPVMVQSLERFMIVRGKVKASTEEKENLLVEFLQKYPYLFKLFQKPSDNVTLWWVKVKTDIQLCENYLGDVYSCSGNCGDLHICKFYLLGEDCGKYHSGGKVFCRCKHDMFSSHNLAILKAYLLEDLTMEELRLVFNPNRAVQAREVDQETGAVKSEVLEKSESDRLTSSKREDKLKPKHRHQRKAGADLPRRGAESDLPGVKLKQNWLKKAELDLQSQGAKPMDNRQEKAESDLPGMKSQNNDHKKAEPDLLSPQGGAEPKDNCQRMAGPTAPKAKSKRKGPQKGKLPASSAKARVNRYRQQEELRSQPQRVETAKPNKHYTAEFCSFFLKGMCQFGAACPDFHPVTRLPYQWQFQSGNSNMWMDADPELSSGLEMAFCDPHSSSVQVYLVLPVTGLYVAEFDTMTLVGCGRRHALRRLGTRSSVRSDTTGLGTDWSWYWRGAEGCWNLYGTSAPGNIIAADVTSTFLEEKYLACPAGQLRTDLYIIDFEAMEQRMVETGTVVTMRRRPVLVTPTTLSLKIRHEAERTCRLAEVDKIIPNSWKSVPGYEGPDLCLLVALTLDGPSMTANECEEIMALVTQSCERNGAKSPGLAVRTIRRIQNLGLLTRFERKKIWIKKTLTDPETILERRLFFVPQQEYKHGFYLQGFHWPLQGSHWAPKKFGQGCYFCVDVPESGYLRRYKELIVARVVTGEYIKGSRSCRALSSPPTFHSCVDDVLNPSIFVIFDVDQAYPEYLVELSLK